MKLRDSPDLIHHITTFFSPRLLHQGGVKCCKLLQNEGEFIVTFPRSFHGGFSLGPNCGEAVNFGEHFDFVTHLAATIFCFSSLLFIPFSQPFMIGFHMQWMRMNVTELLAAPPSFPMTV